MPVYKCRLIIASISFLFVIPIARSQEQTPLEKLKAARQVKEVSIGDNGIPTLLVGRLMPSSAIKTPQEMTFQFFEENKDLYKMKAPEKELKVSSVIKDELNMTHIRLRQQYCGVEVYGGELITHFNSKGELQSINGNLVTDIDVSVAPDVSEEIAEMLVNNHLDSIYGSVKPKVHWHQLLIYRHNNKNYLTWNFFVSISGEHYGEWEYYVDAHTGAIIFKISTLRF